MNIKLYSLLYKKINEDFDLTEVQLITSDLLMLELLIYIQYNLNCEINIVFIRKNRVKTGKFSKFEGILNNKKILLIENLYNNIGNILYIEKCLELKGKHIESIFSPIYNSNIKTKYNLSYFKNKKKELVKKNIYNNVKLIYKSKNQNLFNLYKKNKLVKSNDGFLLIDDNGYLLKFNNQFKIIKKVYLGSEGKISLIPVIFGEKIYVVTDFGNLFKINLYNFVIEDNVPICDSIINRMIINNNKLFILGIHNSINNYRSLYVYNIANGSILEYQVGNINNSDFIVNENNAFFGSNLGKLIVFDFKDIKEYNIDGNIVGGFEEYGNSLLFGTTSGFIYVYSKSDKKIILKKKISNYWILSKPLILGDKIYITSVDKKLYILDFNLNIIDYIRTEGRIFGSPINIGKNIYFGSNDSKLHSLNIENGKITYYQFSERIIQTPLNIDNKLIVQDFLNNIYEIKNNDK